METVIKLDSKVPRYAKSAKYSSFALLSPTFCSGQGLSVLRSLIAECETHGVPQAARCAIATEVFRQARFGSVPQRLWKPHYTNWGVAE